jgi:ketosteroid isomerase-like protein
MPVMKPNKSLSMFVAAGLLLLMGGCQPSNESPAMPDPAVDEAAIRAVLDGIASDFNAGNMEAMMARYLDDVVVSAPGAPDIVGKAAWGQALDAGLPKGVAMTLRFDTVEMLIDGDLAYERGTYAIGIPNPADPAQAAVIKGRHIHIFRRQADGSWKGWRLMENTEDPPGVPAPAAPAGEA